MRAFLRGEQRTRRASVPAERVIVSVAVPVGRKHVRFGFRHRFRFRLNRAITGVNARNEPVKQPQGGFQIAVRQPAFPILAREMIGDTGVSRIDRHSRGDVVQSQALLHRQDKLLEDHAGVFTYHCRAKDFARWGCNNLRDSVGASIDSSAIDLGE